MRCEVCETESLGARESVPCVHCGALLQSTFHLHLAAVKYLIADVLRWQSLHLCDDTFVERTLAPYLAEYDQLLTWLLENGAQAPYAGACVPPVRAEEYLRREAEWLAANALGARSQASSPAGMINDGQVGQEMYFLHRAIEARRRRCATPSAHNGARAGHQPLPYQAPPAPLAAPEVQVLIPFATIVPSPPVTMPTATTEPPATTLPRAHPLTAETASPTTDTPPPAATRTDFPSAPEPAPPRPEEDSAAPEPTADGWSAEAKLRWLLNLGIFIVAAAATVHVYNQWTVWTAAAKLAVLLALTGALSGGGALLKRGYLLHDTGRALFILGTLFFPIDLFAAVHFGVIDFVPGNAVGALGGLACAAAYVTLALRDGGTLFAYLGAAAGVAAYGFALRWCAVPLTHFPAHASLLWILYLVGGRAAAGPAPEKAAPMHRFLVGLAHWVSVCGWVLAVPAQLILLMAGEVTLGREFATVLYGLLGAAAFAMLLAWLARMPEVLWLAAPLKGLAATLALQHAGLPVAEWGQWLMPLGTLFWAAALRLRPRIGPGFAEPYVVAGGLISMASLTISVMGCLVPLSGGAIPILMGTLAWPTAAFALLATVERTEWPGFAALAGLAVEYTLWLTDRGVALEWAPVWLAAAEPALLLAYGAVRRGRARHLAGPFVAAAHLLALQAVATMLWGIEGIYGHHAGLGLAACAVATACRWAWAGLFASPALARVAALFSAGTYVLLLRSLGVAWTEYMLWFDGAALALVVSTERGAAHVAAGVRLAGHLLALCGIGLACADLASTDVLAMGNPETLRCAVAGLLATVFYAWHARRGGNPEAELAALVLVVPSALLVLVHVGTDRDAIRPILMVLAAGYFGLSLALARRQAKAFVATALACGLALVSIDLGATLADTTCYEVKHLACPIFTTLVATAILAGLRLAPPPVPWFDPRAAAAGATCILPVTFVLTLRWFGADAYVIRWALMALAAGYVCLAYAARALPGRPFVESAVAVALFLLGGDLFATLVDPTCYEAAHRLCPILTTGLACLILLGLGLARPPVEWLEPEVPTAGAALLLPVTYALTLWHIGADTYELRFLVMLLAVAYVGIAYGVRAGARRYVADVALGVAALLIVGDLAVTLCDPACYLPAHRLPTILTTAAAALLLIGVRLARPPASWLDEGVLAVGAALLVPVPYVLALAHAGFDGHAICPFVMLLAGAYAGVAYGCQYAPGRPFIQSAMGVGLGLAAGSLCLALGDLTCYLRANLFCPILTCLFGAAITILLCFCRRPVNWLPGALLSSCGAVLVLVAYLLELQWFAPDSAYGPIAVFGLSPALAAAGWAMRRRGMTAEWGPFVAVALLESGLALALSAVGDAQVRILVCFACSAFWGGIGLLFGWRVFSFLASLAVIGAYFTILQELHVPSRLYGVWLVTLALGKVVTGSVVESHRPEPQRHPMVVVGLGITFMALGELAVNARAYVGNEVWIGIGVAFLCATVYVAAWLFQKNPLFLYLSGMSLIGAYYIYAFHNEWTAWEAYTLPIAGLVLAWAHLVGRRIYESEEARVLDAVGIGLLVGPSIVQALDITRRPHALAALLLSLWAVVIGMPLRRRVYVVWGTVAFVLTVLIWGVQILREAGLSGTTWWMLVGGAIFAFAALLEYVRRARQRAIERGEGGVRAWFERWLEGWE